MDARRRMFTTFAALAVTMSCGAGLLAWLQPMSRCYAAHSDPRQAVRQLLAGRSSATGMARTTGTWTAIELVVTSSPATRGPGVLLATSSAWQHLSVDPTGLIHVHRHWEDVDPADLGPPTLTIAIPAADDAEDFSPAQHQRLTELVGLLAERLAIGQAGRSPVHVVAWDESAIPAAEALGRRIAAGDFTKAQP